MRLSAILLSALLFASCFGMSSDITIHKDGSGTAALEYRISKEMLSLGNLDGNDAFPAVPVGEEDFKRTVDRIDGLELTAFSSKAEDENLVYKVKLSFSNLDALSAFLDTQGQQCLLSEKDGYRIFTVVFTPGTEEYSPEMRELMPLIFEGSPFNFKLSFPGASNVVFFDRAGGKIAAPPLGKADTGAKSLSFSAPMGDVFASGETIAFEARWKK
jgi:hypothetical protein